MDRRSFMKAILAAGIAPYVSTAAGVLMPIRQRVLWLWGDGIHDDTEALQALLNGERVGNIGMATAELSGGGVFLSKGRFLVSSTLVLPSKTHITDSFFTGKLHDEPLFKSMGTTDIQLSGLHFESLEATEQAQMSISL